MFQYTSSRIKFKVFVKETNGEHQPEKSDYKAKYLAVAPLTGSKAREFYEDILKESTVARKEKKSSKQQKPRIKRSANPSAQTKKFKNTDLLWMAQNNDVKNLRLFFAQNQDQNVNVVDDFGWTPLMCACCSGAKDAVEILLENGADPIKCDRLGNSPLKLALQKNQTKIVQLLENWKNKSDIIDEEEKSDESSGVFFCPTCKENFTSNKDKHENSTLHLFNSPLKTSTFYGIPESNKGYQLLLREGWDKEKGLGRDGTGRKFPVRAVPKKDKTGIGAPPPPHKKRERDAKNSETFESKKIKMYKSWREKHFERNFRLEFS